MDYERLYKDALEKAKRMYNSAKELGFDVDAKNLETIFPELKESEDDRIKEDLIQWINEFPDTIWRGHYKKDVISWLEKQGDKDKFIEKELGYIKNYRENAIKRLEQLEKQCEKEEVDGFDAELNALLKKYEYLPKEELAECLEFYLGVVKNMKI